MEELFHKNRQRSMVLYTNFNYANFTSVISQLAVSVSRKQRGFNKERKSFYNH